MQDFVKEFIAMPQWHRCPNRDSRFYTSRRSLPKQAEVHVYADRIRIVERVFVGEAYTRRSWHDEKTLEIFDSMPAFLEWYEKTAEKVEPYTQPWWID